VHLALVVVQLVFASQAVVARVVLREIAPVGLVALRAPAAALLFFAARALFGWERVAPRDLARLVLYGLLGVVVNQLSFMNGLQRSTATNAVVVNATIPVFVVGIAVLLRRETATPAKLGGLAVALFGALAVVGLERFSAGGGHGMGNLFFVVNSLSFALYLVLSRDVLRRYRALTVISWTMLFGALGVLPVGASELARALPRLSPGAWAGIAYIVVFPTVIAYFLNVFALARAPSSLVAAYVYLQPLVGAIMAAVWLGERPGPGARVGALLIFAGIALVARGAAPRKR
jgi:drug/metabolite transporter (DMT)-like permease